MKAWICASLIFVLGCSASTLAADNEDILTSRPFLAHHPDLAGRLEGMRAYEQRDYSGAMEHFLDAARYGDKLSQAMVSQMHRLGQGVPADLVSAYAWMDLAAERGYSLLVVEREKLWSRLDGGQRQSAVRKGVEIDREYGDAAAKPRMKRILMRATRSRTGSRLGAVGTMRVHAGMAGGAGNSSVRARTSSYGTGDQLYASKYWKPAEYWAWQDEKWRPDGSGEIGMGSLEAISPDAASEK